MDYQAISKETIGFLYRAHANIRRSELDNKWVALAELRVSQLIGCPFCCHFHSNELRAMGIDQELIDKLPGWKHSTLFDPIQVLVLQWTDAVTLMKDGLPAIKEELEQHFTEKQLVELTASISLMNALTRLRVTLGDPA
jgi:AhpD family alkylhydroperoxidase